MLALHAIIGTEANLEIGWKQHTKKLTRMANVLGLEKTP
jgi:hypothetical protein